MVKRSGLSMLANRPDPEPIAETSAEPAPPPKLAPVKVGRARKAAGTAAKEGGSRYAGQVHVGASYDENDDTVEGFRHLVYKTRRSSKELLHEAMQLLVAKYDQYKPPAK